MNDSKKGRMRRYPFTLDLGSNEAMCGSSSLPGHFGFYRKVCSNGLHVSQAEIEFSIKHSKNNTELIMPIMNGLFDKFLNDEFYAIVRIFEKMKDFKIIDTKKFVTAILNKLKLFRYEYSDTNETPSKKSRKVLETLNYEALLLNEEPNLALGYNTFNAMLHNTLKKTFSQQEKWDKKLFNEIYEMV